ncbi:Carboxylesterase, type B [Arthrobacter sp. FB24]|uniref:carboxylesterase/lipase family protein n=1 Tax=Arthrobacter sp. (strain FB24) TaxID=290399 RepID=UPI000052714C|nr:carboxylesterase family protein [Arthrobacter sp. FB24]ABK05358.1 Carboxylesterase, type B [Arthrobacter sp. FB24]
MDTVVKTTHGQLRGSLADGVHCFLGIPFAASTAGVNRLRPPQPVQPWSGVRDAMKYGDSPFQLAPPESAGTEWDTALAGEDCLNLNVWTPDPGNGGLPVMVWIQGGAFEIGSTASYNGRTFARDGVICVVINWRVGADGFLDLGDGQANIGLLDQVAALEWVRGNIAAFGEDPANVTVFGQSAGAMSIGVLLSMPRAEGLFRRAILQSGAAHHVLPTETAQRIGGFLSEKLGVSPTREAMAAVPVQRFLAAQTELKADLAARPDPARWGPEVVASSMLWQPSVDGDVIPRRPIERIAAGAGSTVDVMIGSNAEDWKLFLAITGVIAKVTERDLAESRSVDGFPPIGVYGLPAETALREYRSHYPASSPGELLAAVETDWWVRIPALRLADAHAKALSTASARTYMYEFAWPAPGLGAVHAMEVPFVFDTLDTSSRLFGPLLGTDPPQELADAMHAAWISFASTGDPGWPGYDLERRATMLFNTGAGVVYDPRSWERDLWEGVR